MALTRVLAARLGVICLPTAAPMARVQGPGVMVQIFVVDDWSGFPRLSDRGEYDELAWVGWEQAEMLRLADPRLLVLVKAALTTPEDYPHHS